MSNLKEITLYSHDSGPNPWKIAILLEELSLPYKTEFVDFSKIKAEPFISTNPNGRVPAIDDPNTGITLWESGAIAQYLIENYDKEGKISHQSAPEKYYEWQWAAFQISGQGPYFGQAAWFTFFHPEQLPSAKERYTKEIDRVTSVIDSYLAKQKTEYLVGNKCTYADLMFITWADLGDHLNPDLKKYQNYQAWLGRLKERPAVKKVLDEKKAMADKKGMAKHSA